MNLLRGEFFEEGQRLDADPKTRHLSVCWMPGCGMRIDYTAAPSSTADSHNLDHAKSVEDFPELQEDPANFRHSHFNCNTSRGKKSVGLGLGEQMPDWW